jgi:hypothetical protein
MPTRRSGLAVLLAGAIATACSGGAAATASPDAADAGAASPTPAADGGARDAGTLPPVSGTYSVSTALDLTKGGVLPDAASTTFVALANLKEHPAKTLLDLLKAANVPIVSTVLAWLPGVLSSSFEGWIDMFITSTVYKESPKTDALASLATDLGKLATEFEVVSTLRLPAPDAMGKVTASHALAGVAFTIGGTRTELDLPDALGEETRADDVHGVALHVVEKGDDVEDGVLTLGDHKAGLVLSKYIAAAINSYTQASFGEASLRAALGRVIDCDAMGTSIAGECIAEVCVGHKDDLVALCQAGLDEVEAQVTSALTSLDLDLHFESAQATMWRSRDKGGARSAAIERLEGVWVLAVKPRIGSNAESVVPATFVARRVEDSRGR